jgi:hypothetical protein
MRRWADQHAIGFRQGLKASRQIGGVADDGLLSGGADAGCFASNDKTGRDSQAALQWRSIRLLQLSNRLHDFQSGPDRALRRVLLRLWKTEIDENAVA